MFSCYSPDLELIFICIVFSLLSSLSKQLYDSRLRRRSIYIIFTDVLVSAMMGTIFALLFSEFNESILVLIGISGLGGMFGSSAIKLLIQFKLGRRIKIQIGFDEGDNGNVGGS